MRTGFTSRTATKVKVGKVQPKNRNQPTSHKGYVIDRESPGSGFKHVASKSDVQSFVALLPEWDRYAERLERIVLAGPSHDCDGMYEFFHREETGAIYLHAWADDLWIELAMPYFEAHRCIFDRLGVRYDVEESLARCYFSESQARAFTLLHVFLHELGHHFDRIHQKHLGSTKGEDYAERFANSRFEMLFPLYVSAFGDPRLGK